MMTEAFRRDRRMTSFAIHLFIDAFPSGWMKAIMDVDRGPKPAYFAYRDALTPLMANLRSDRHAFFSGEEVRLEDWGYNDLVTVSVIPCGMGARHFVSRGSGHYICAAFTPDDFKFWYNAEVGYVTPLLAGRLPWLPPRSRWDKGTCDCVRSRWRGECAAILRRCSSLVSFSGWLDPSPGSCRSHMTER